MSKNSREILAEVFMMLGIVIICHGPRMIYVPIGWIFLGLMTFGFGIIGRIDKP